VCNRTTLHRGCSSKQGAHEVEQDPSRGAGGISRGCLSSYPSKWHVPRVCLPQPVLATLVVWWILPRTHTHTHTHTAPNSSGKPGEETHETSGAYVQQRGACSEQCRSRECSHTRPGAAAARIAGTQRCSHTPPHPEDTLGGMNTSQHRHGRNRQQNMGARQERKTMGWVWKRGLSQGAQVPKAHLFTRTHTHTHTHTHTSGTPTLPASKECP
jgi:hypothetical protein